MAFDLNPYQKKAVNAEGNCLVVACPGSGKTRVLSTRAARLLSASGDGNLCAVTFTRDAAQELKSRILEEFQGSNEAAPAIVSRIAAGTFHSLSMVMLKRHRANAPIRILNDGERLSIISQVLASRKIPLDINLAFETIEAIKAQLNPEKILARQENQDLFEGYQEHLAHDDAMDFADLLLRAVRGMEQGEIPPLAIRWLLVDEAQDLDEVQLRWVDCHARAGVRVTLVGDDDQSLYSFRHALGYHGMMSFAEDHKAEKLTLPVNYRCEPIILNHAAKLIQHNEVRARKDIQAFKQGQGRVDVRVFADRSVEAEAVIETLQGERNNLNNWAILARTNSTFHSLTLRLRSAGIRYYFPGEDDVWSKKIPGAYISLLRSIVTGTRVGIVNTLNVCGVPSQYLKILTDLKGEDDIADRLSWTADKCRMISGNRRDRYAEIIHSLGAHIIEWRRLIENRQTNLVITTATDWFVERYKQFCRQQKRNASKDGTKESTEDRYIRIIQEGAQILKEKLKGSLTMRLDIITGRPQAPKDKDQGASSHVTLLSLHGSKGLEWDNVWIIGVEDGLLPHTDSAVEEERRLMYVGMTRARENLVISSTLSAIRPSRFITEAGLTASLSQVQPGRLISSR